jgi:hypothetical protein
MIVGCYDLNLYCDEPGHKPRPAQDGADAEYCAETGGECRRDARKAGWKLQMRNSRAICPTCAKQMKR